MVLGQLLAVEGLNNEFIEFARQKLLQYFVGVQVKRFNVVFDAGLTIGWLADFGNYAPLVDDNTAAG